MYLIAAITVVVYIIWGFCTRKEEISIEGSDVLKPFNKMACLLYKKALIRKLPLFRSAQVKRDLERMYPGKASTHQQMLFYVKKLSVMLLAFLAGTLLCAALKFQSEATRQLTEDSVLKRGSYKEGAHKIILEAQVEGLEKQYFPLYVNERILNFQDAGLLEEEFWSVLSAAILGDNPSADQIRQDLNLAEDYAGYPFSASYKSSRPDVITRKGRVKEVEEETEVIITVTISYYEWEWSHDIILTVIPPYLTEEEQTRQQLERLLEESDETSKMEEEWQLPLNISGESIIWEEQLEDNSLPMWLLVIITAAGIYFLSDKDLHSQYEKYKKQMKEAYPLIVNKMALYLGAGMTVRGTCQKIADDYMTAREQGSPVHPAYEELLYTCRELKAGISESIAYEHLGRRSGLTEYIKLCALLTQNLKKGNSTLLNRLREEAEIAMQTHIQYKKKQGEEASTKLLLPMVMMLAVVMLLIMLPAFSSMGI